MRALFGRGLHPDADQIIALETAAGATPGGGGPGRRSWAGRSRSTRPLAAARGASRGPGGGVRGRERAPAPPVVRSKIEAQEARRERRAVAGYDLVFTPVKSVSLLWALGSAATRQAVEDAHHEAVADTLAWLEARDGVRPGRRPG